jgi:phosphoribosylformylglycinamidine cyclo-ligase
MFNIFNMGIGMVIALDEKDAQRAIEILEAEGERASIIGRVVDGEGVTIL